MQKTIFVFIVAFITPYIINMDLYDNTNPCINWTIKNENCLEVIRTLRYLNASANKYEEKQYKQEYKLVGQGLEIKPGGFHDYRSNTDLDYIILARSATLYINTKKRRKLTIYAAQNSKTYDYGDKAIVQDIDFYGSTYKSRAGCLRYPYLKEIVICGVLAGIVWFLSTRFSIHFIGEDLAVKVCK
jgi:hypothetical protein